MKLGPDGSFYVAGSAQLLKVPQDGPSVILAGTATTGFTGVVARAPELNFRPDDRRRGQGLR